MNEKDFTLLHDYFNGLLSEEEARAVEARAAAEPAFGEEFALRRQMEAFPRLEAERNALLHTLKNAGADYFQENKSQSSPTLSVVRNNTRRWMALAAALTLVAAAVWFFNRGDAPTYRQYAQHPRLSLTVMGNTEQARTDAETAFAQKDYARALSALDQVLAAEPDNIKAAFFRGICLLELDRSAEARQIFEVLAVGNSALREDAVWYVALSYLQENNPTECRNTLQKIAPGAAHYEQAQQLLKKL